VAAVVATKRSVVEAEADGGAAVSTAAARRGCPTTPRSTSCMWWRSSCSTSCSPASAVAGLRLPDMIHTLSSASCVKLRAVVTTDAGPPVQHELKPPVDAAAVVAPAIESKRSSRSAEGASAEASAVTLPPSSTLPPRPSWHGWEDQRGSWPPP
jgi:hypothetical protein